MIDIMAFGAHPDDIEFGCGGILAKASSQNYSIVLIDLSLGEKSTHGNPEERKHEGEAAAKVIGAKRHFLDFADCEIFDTYKGRLKLTQVIREYKPRLVIAPLPETSQNHPDHIACGHMVRYACRYARFSKLLSDIPIHYIEGILYYLPQASEKVDFVIDVSNHIDKWKEMMEMHKSQMNTYPYSDWMLRKAAHLGDLIGKPYAQGLVSSNPIEIEDLMSLSHSSREF